MEEFGPVDPRAGFGADSLSRPVPLTLEEIVGRDRIRSLEARTSVSFRLQWTREDRRKPGIVGTETLVMELDDPKAGKVYLLPGPFARAEYGLATPSLRQGAYAKRLSGTARVVEVDDAHVTVLLDLSARMARVDVDGGFDERVQGRFRLPRR